MTGPLFTTGAIAAAVLLSCGTTQAAKLDTSIAAFRSTADSTPIEGMYNALQASGIPTGILGGSIKLSGKNIKVLNQYIADAIINRSVPINGETNLTETNKAEEIAESTAYMINIWQTSPKFKGSKAKGAVKNIAAGALKTFKAGAALFNTSLARDVGGSMALTIANNPILDIKTKQKLAKTLNKSAKKVAGKSAKLFFQAGLNEGGLADATANMIYEDGNLAASLTAIQDPETDFRPL